MDKKAYALYWYMFMFGIFLSIGAFFYYYTINETPVDGDYIGHFQLKIIKSLQGGEKVLIYIDQSAKYSLQQAIYELAQNGGFSTVIGDEGISFETNECGKFNGVNIWYKLKKDEEGNIIKIPCFDEKLLADNLGYKFDENFNQYLINYPSNILTNNYDYEFKGSLEIIGRAREPLIFDILKDETKAVMKKPTEIKIPIEFREKESKPAEEKPKEEIKTEKPVEVKPPTEAKDFIDFTGTDLCQKGTQCKLTKEAYGLLSEAERIAKQKLKQYGIRSACLEREDSSCLEVTSAYRSIKEQESIWKRNPNSKMVCPPSPKCPHTTGNVVDIRFDGKTFATMTNTDWVVLEQIMTSVKNDKGEIGWVRYANEEWHFECCGTPRYARAKEKGVIAIV